MALRRDGFSSLSFPQWQPNCFPSSCLSSLIFLLCYFLIDLFSICLSAAHREPLSHSRIPPETRGETKQQHKHPLCHTTNAHAHKRKVGSPQFSAVSLPKVAPKNTSPSALIHTLCLSHLHTHIHAHPCINKSPLFSLHIKIHTYSGTKGNRKAHAYVFSFIPCLTTPKKDALVLHQDYSL